MFVRILTKQMDDEEKKIRSRDLLYECKRVSMEPIGDDGKAVMLTIDIGNQVERNVHVEKGISEVYYMNEAGKTIDSYQW